MAAIHLITGGARSGKSDHALELAEEHGDSRAYLATCPVEDEEMRQRVEKHRRRRKNRGWHTIEEQVELARAVRGAEQSVLLIDCLTLWVSNLMGQEDERLTEDRIEELSSDLLDACRNHGGPCYIVTNEVGMGVVPGNRAARRFRDLAGRANQVIASGADHVTLMVCGIATRIKSQGHHE